MPNPQTDFMRRVPSMAPSQMPAMSDDECLARLAKALEEHDSGQLGQLGEVARLIGRLAVTIE